MQIALKLQLDETYWITKDEKVITHYLLNKILTKKIEKCQKTWMTIKIENSTKRLRNQAI